MITSCSTPDGSFWSVTRYGGATVAARVFVEAHGDDGRPCKLTPNQARELADALIYEAARAEEINASANPA